MKPITKNQIAAFYALLKVHGLQDDKASIVRSISHDRTESTRELSFEEAQQWIIAMNKKSAPVQKNDPRQKMVNSIIAMAREMGVIVRVPMVKVGGSIEYKSNYAGFNKWMQEKSYLKKNLNEYTYKELTKLVSQFQAIYKSWLGKHH